MEKIGIDLSHSCLKPTRGIGVHERNIGIPRKIGKHSKIYVFGVGKRPNELQSNINYVNTHFKNHLLREQFIIPFWVFFLGLKKLHLFSNVAPVFLKFNKHCEIFLTIHDVSFKYAKSYFEKSISFVNFRRRIALNYHSYLFEYSIKKAVKIFTVSSWALNEIFRYSSVKIKDKIFVVNNEVDKRYLSDPLPKWDNKNNEILIVSGSHPQKNMDFLLGNLIRHNENNNLLAGYSINIVGIESSYLNSKYARENNFYFYGQLENKELIKLYDRAKLLIMPSLFESFSIPIIEAESRNIWILSSANGATKEIAPDYTIFFDPRNKTSFDDSFENIFKKLSNAPRRRKDMRYRFSSSSDKYWRICYDAEISN